MKKIILALALSVFTLVANAASDPIKVFTNTEKPVEVFVIGHQNGQYMITRNGYVICVNADKLKLSDEQKIEIDLADHGMKERYEKGMAISKATENSPSKKATHELFNTLKNAK